MLDIVLDVKPTPKGRPRLNKIGFIYTPSKTSKMESAIRFLLMAEMSKKRISKTDKLVIVEISFIFKYQKGITNDGTMMYAKKKSDIDNMAKLVLDAMNDIVYEDDKQVVKLICDKRYGDNDCIHLKVNIL